VKTAETARKVTGALKDEGRAPRILLKVTGVDSEFYSFIWANQSEVTFVKHPGISRLDLLDMRK
jgi:hypothetical protein